MIRKEVQTNQCVIESNEILRGKEVDPKALAAAGPEMYDLLLEILQTMDDKEMFYKIVNLLRKAEGQEPEYT